ncbi:class I SAM-dependent methyltransferase [Sandaracinobacter sp. RS1-74]|uniref:class I SAM-dependent methyltransferase n=1 Tax=Sandaracinobacteroides sayramensis TaxID=2913411 RepID=UPI001EDC1588|nr:class I SAM-dependent methyltransferase [Sandaracinobacteroides sayramensis]MCG2840307.1 class I SAM-dependent methyltransferase [Sandaracinobacteroides sayramensis]
MGEDRSEGWDGVAEQFMAVRTGTGATLVRDWARANLPPSSAIVDVGCGSGMPIAQVLAEDGFAVFGIDASPLLIAAFRRRFPHLEAACEPAEDSPFFHRSFAGAVSIGLLFLLPEERQRAILGRVADALEPGGRFLFSSPAQPCEWRDSLTGRLSRSPGRPVYAQWLEASGLHLSGCHLDEGGNHYFHAVKPL